MSIKFLILFHFCILGNFGQIIEQQKIECNEDFCRGITDDCPPERNCTTARHRTSLYPGPCNCCSYCYDFLEEDATCSVVSNLPYAMCGSLLECNPEDKICEQMKGLPGSCAEVYREYLEREATASNGIAEFLPSCNSHGKYNLRQCLPTSPVCLCMSEDGEPLFGIELANKKQDCGCARAVWQLQKLGIYGNGPRCLPNGDYDDLQCPLQTRRCHCRLRPQYSVSLSELTETDEADLIRQCYNDELHSDGYVGVCERLKGKYDVLKDVEVKNETHAISVQIGDLPKCGPDGGFAVIQSRGSKWICVNSTGEQIENFEMEKIDGESSENDPPSTIDCHCARIRHFLDTNEYTIGKPKCCSNGNFRKYQCTGGICYCVDSIGRQIMKPDSPNDPIEVPASEVHLLPCYRNACP